MPATADKSNTEGGLEDEASQMRLSLCTSHWTEGGNYAGQGETDP